MSTTYSNEYQWRGRVYGRLEAAIRPLVAKYDLADEPLRDQATGIIASVLLAECDRDSYEDSSEDSSAVPLSERDYDRLAAIDLDALVASIAVTPGEPTNDGFLSATHAVVWRALGETVRRMTHSEQHHAGMHDPRESWYIVGRDTVGLRSGGRWIRARSV